MDRDRIFGAGEGCDGFVLTGVNLFMLCKKDCLKNLRREPDIWESAFSTD